MSEAEFSVKMKVLIVVDMFCIDLRKLGESEAQCNTLREEVKQLKAEIEQLKVGGRSAGVLLVDLTPYSQKCHIKYCMADSKDK